MKILLVEDDASTRSVLATTLTAQHYTVNMASDGQTGLSLAEQLEYDLILLDIGIPKLDGLSLCQHLRRQGSQCPILLLTAEGSATDRVIGLDAGADDYMIKPFDVEELLARVRALLRRSKAIAPTAILTWENLHIDASTSSVTCDDQPLRLTPKEYGLVELFLLNPKRVFSRRAILDRLWDLSESPGEETVSTHIKCVRQKIKAAGGNDLIETVHGLGYRLRSPYQTPAPDAVSTGILQAAPLQKTTSQKTTSQKITSQKITAQLSQIWEQSKDGFTQQMAVLERASASLTLGEFSPELHQQAQREAHKLAGALGIFGLMEGSRLAREIEMKLQPHADLNVDEFAAWVNQLRQVLHEPPLEQSEKSKEHPIPTHRIMIVDDDPTVLQRLTVLLEPLGNQVIRLGDEQKFWQVLTTAQPHLLLLDLEMPQISGIELCQQVRHMPPWQDLPIVLLSAHTDVAAIDQAFTAGADDYIPKSMSEAELITRVMHRLRRSALRYQS